jgi:hypothetical protein
MGREADMGVPVKVVASSFLAAGLLFLLPAEAAGPADYELLLEKKSEGLNFEDTPWKEIEAVLPLAPSEDNLRPIDVNQLSSNLFFVDEASVAYGSDDVIRYTMVVLSPSGARNVSFEGMRCETGERRLYAFLRSDGSWSRARNSAWARIEGSKVNRQHAALYRDYFCTTGGMVVNTEQARRALRYGNPAAVNR